MTRTDIINLFIHHRRYRTYLEIGVASGWNLVRVQCEQKQGVDPAVRADGVAQIDSDTFLSQCATTFDLIFIDGSHDEDQVDRDIVNSLRRLNPGGVIVLHDCLPPHEWHQRSSADFRPGEAWTGTVWKSVLKYFAISEYSCYVVNSDWGCGVIDTARPARASQRRQLPPHLVYTRDFILLREYLQSERQFLDHFQEPAAVGKEPSVANAPTAIGK